MIVLDKKLEDVQAPGRRTLQAIINDVNELGVSEGQVNELLDCLLYLAERLTHSETERFKCYETSD